MLNPIITVQTVAIGKPIFRLMMASKVAEIDMVIFIILTNFVTFNKFCLFPIAVQNLYDAPKGRKVCPIARLALYGSLMKLSYKHCYFNAMRIKIKRMSDTTNNNYLIDVEQHVISDITL